MNRDLTGSLVCAVGIIALALAATYARRLGYIDGDTVTRIVLGATGLILVWYGNRMPKSMIRGAGVRQATRIGAWSMVLSGLVYAGLWAVAPVQTAIIGGCAAVLTGLAVTFGYCLSLKARAKAA